MSKNLLTDFVHRMKDKHDEALTGAKLASNKNDDHAVLFTTIHEFAGALNSEIAKVKNLINYGQNQSVNISTVTEELVNLSQEMGGYDKPKELSDDEKLIEQVRDPLFCGGEISFKLTDRLEELIRQNKLLTARGVRNDKTIREIALLGNKQQAEITKLKQDQKDADKSYNELVEMNAKLTKELDTANTAIYLWKKQKGFDAMEDS